MVIIAKITIVGAGNVGGQAAYYCALRNLGDIVIIDIVEGLPQGKALDMLQAMPLAGNDNKILGTNDYSDTKDSDVVVVTAGVPRKPGMSRSDLIEVNAKIMSSIIPQVIKYSPNCILIIVSNPLDAMVHLAYKLSSFPSKRVIGMAGVLDSTRFRAFLAMELNASVKDIQAMVLGGHGDLMVPLVKHCTVKGESIKTLLSEEKIKEIIERVKKAGGEIVGLLKTGSAFFAPGLSINEMVESIIKDQKKILPCSVMVNGEYDAEGIFIGVPTKLGKQGVEEIIELDLSEKEKQAFQKSVEHVKELVEKL